MSGVIRINDISSFARTESEIVHAYLAESVVRTLDVVRASVRCL
jgi:hypothetical protein